MVKELEFDWMRMCLVHRVKNLFWNVAKNETSDLVFLFLVTLLLSIYLFFNMHVISLDGLSQHIPMAKMFAAGSFREALSYSGQQPLYAFLVSLASRGVGDVELAARLVSSLFGILLVFPAYLLVKEISDRRVAFLSVLFLAVHPYIRRFSADVLKESTYLFFFATSLWLILRALRREQLYLFLLVPIFSGLAYLVRPDGVEPLFAVFFYVIFAKKFSVSGKKGKTIILLLLSSGILLLPYLSYLRGVTGEWTLSKTKGITEFFGLELVKSGTLLINHVSYSLWQIVRGNPSPFSAGIAGVDDHRFRQKGLHRVQRRGWLLPFALDHPLRGFIPADAQSDRLEWGQGFLDVFLQRQACPASSSRLHLLDRRRLCYDSPVAFQEGSLLHVVPSHGARETILRDPGDFGGPTSGHHAPQDVKTPAS